MNQANQQVNEARPNDETTCAICGGMLREDIARPCSTYAERGAYRIATCISCGCGQTLPRPTVEELSALYARDYNYDAHLLIAKEKRRRAGHILDLVMRPGDRRVLDVGCMYGYLLDEARERGAEKAVGVELSAGPAKIAKDRGHDVFLGTIEELEAEKPAPFDVIVAQHVLEHVPDVASFVSSARRMLAPGGRLCVVVPNYDARARRVFREAWAWYQVPMHLHHFSGQALTQLLEKNGYAIEREDHRGGDSLFVMLTILQGLGRGPSSEAASPGPLQKAVVRAASSLLRPYYRVGEDELLVVATPRSAGP